MNHGVPKNNHRAAQAKAPQPKGGNNIFSYLQATSNDSPAVVKEKQADGPRRDDQKPPGNSKSKRKIYN